jgi:uncharacterized protein (DUF433 family)
MLERTGSFYHGDFNSAMSSEMAPGEILFPGTEGAMANNGNSVIMQDPEVLSGEPVFRGTRVPFQALLDYLEGGETLDEFLKQFPGVSRENAIAALEEAKSLMMARFGK